MGIQNRHTIGKQVFQLLVPDATKAFALQQEVSKLFWESIVPALEQLFDQYANPDVLISIAQLDLDLGFIPEKNWQETFTTELLKKIEQVLNDQSSLGTKSAKISKQPIHIAQFQQWLHFLEFGYLPWNVSLNESVEALQKSALDTLASEALAPGQLRHLVAQNDHAFDRLLLQHPETFLKTLCGVFTARHQDELLTFRQEWTSLVQETLKKRESIPSNISTWINEQRPERPTFFWKKILEAVILEEKQLPTPALISIFFQKLAPINQVPLLIDFIKKSEALLPESELLVLKHTLFTIPAETFIAPSESDIRKNTKDSTIPSSDPNLESTNLGKERANSARHTSPPDATSLQTQNFIPQDSSIPKSANQDLAGPAARSGENQIPGENIVMPPGEIFRKKIEVVDPEESTHTSPSAEVPPPSPAHSDDDPNALKTGFENSAEIPLGKKEAGSAQAETPTPIESFIQTETPLTTESFVQPETPPTTEPFVQAKNSLASLLEPVENKPSSKITDEVFIEKTTTSQNLEATPIEGNELNFSQKSTIDELSLQPPIKGNEHNFSQQEIPMLENPLQQQKTGLPGEGFEAQSSSGNDSGMAELGGALPENNIFQSSTSDDSGQIENKESRQYPQKSPDSLSEDREKSTSKAETASLPLEQFQSDAERAFLNSTKNGDQGSFDTSSEENLPGTELPISLDQDEQSETSPATNLLHPISDDQVLKKAKASTDLETFQENSIISAKAEKQFEQGPSSNAEHPNPETSHPEEQVSNLKQIFAPDDPNNPAWKNQNKDNPDTTLPDPSENPIGTDQRKLPADTPLDSKDIFLIGDKIPGETVHGFSPEEKSQLAQYQENALTPSKATPLPKPLAPKPAPIIQEGANWFIQHAGIVLLHPFLPHFFGGLGLLDGKNFKDDAARHRAVHLLHYLVTSETGLPEFMLLLPKLLCGLPFEEPMERFIEFTDIELLECEELLKAAVKNWGAIGNASPAALREGFLNRDGKLEMRTNGWHLTVERKTIDILLNKLPWGLGIVKLPWMDGFLQVEWH